ncbi:sensor histidine kinase [Subtercola frigoramans]|uniref:histidine kinase n=1 Tax=Subtercola frigoramans TaxID=120298 RepID=A0ABS2L8W4_9MICO|nr:PAS domain-containing sensor histidine kinase [Subtercola frigoramans]MBM7473434.1 signal transduction histidine kinase [Subtercola frigoramans]
MTPAGAASAGEMSAGAALVREPLTDEAPAEPGAETRSGAPAGAPSTSARHSSTPDPGSTPSMGQRAAAADSRAASVGRAGLERAVFQSQLPFAAVALLLVCAEFFFQPTTLTDPFFFGGGTAIFVITAIAAVVPWGRYDRRWVMVLPIADMLAVAVLAHGTTDLAASALFAFPVIWLSTYFGAAGTTYSAAGSAALIWGGAILDGSTVTAANIPGLLVLPVTLAFIAAVTFLRSKRSAAQLALLRQQASLLEGAHRRARRQEQTLDAVLNSVEFGVVAFDREGRETLVNRAHQNLIKEFGQSAKSPEPPRMYQADRVSLVPDDLRPYRQAVLGNTYQDFIVWIGEPGGHRKALSISARQVIGSDGRNDGGVMVTRDVTSEVNAIQARDDLVASVSHELRTPLTSILGYLDLALDDETLSPMTSSNLKVASANADRLLALISDLFVAVSDSDHLLVMSFDECDVNEIVTQSIQAQQLLAQQRGISLSATASGPALLIADGFRLRQVVDNLLTNAIKYNKDNGLVRIDVQSRPNEVTITVSDTGIGLTEMEQSRLFERYFRAESVRQSSIHGSGLGMSISRDIVRRHGGDLTVSSTIGVGSEFVVRLPLEQLELA